MTASTSFAMAGFALVISPTERESFSNSDETLYKTHVPPLKSNVR